MEIPLYQVDAFTDRLFGGNPAAVCALTAWLPDNVLQQIAAENNLAETAFLVPGGDGYHLRWFTPTMEVDLCGHATLAAAWVVFRWLAPRRTSVPFATRSGMLTVDQQGDKLVLDFPARPPSPCTPPAALLKGLQRPPRAVFRSRDYLAVYDNEEEVRALAVDMSHLARLDSLGVIVTAPGRQVDFVSRFFAPQAGIPEDPVTGSAHCTLAPYWVQRLGRHDLHARQLSPRGGELWCRLVGQRVLIAGRAVPYLKGSILLDDPAG